MPTPEHAAGVGQDSHYEYGFVHAGLPYFSRTYQQKNLTKLFGVLVLVVGVVEMVVPALLVGNSNPWLPLLSVVVFLGGWTALWVLQSQRPAGMGNRLWVVQVLWFVIVPASLPTVPQGRWGASLGIVALNIVLLGSVVAFRRYAVLPVAMWSVRHLIDQLRDTFGLLIKALPFLFLVVMLAFYTTDPWQITHSLPWPLLAVVLTAVSLLAVALMAARSKEQIVGMVTPAFPLSSAELRNCRMVVVVSEIVIVGIVTLATFASLVALGVVTVPVDLLTSWTGDPTIIATFVWADTQLAVTKELFMVAALLSSFAMLQFTVALVSGATDTDFLSGMRTHIDTQVCNRDQYLGGTISKAAGDS